MLILQPLARDGFLFPSQSWALTGCLLNWATWIGMFGYFIWDARRSHLKLTQEGFRYVTVLTSKIPRTSRSISVKWSEVSEVAVTSQLPTYLLITLKPQSDGAEQLWPQRRIRVDFHTLNIKFADFQREIELRFGHPVKQLVLKDESREYPAELEVPVAVSEPLEVHGPRPLKFGPSRIVKRKLQFGTLAFAAYAIILLLADPHPRPIPEKAIGAAIIFGLLFLGCALVAWAPANSRLNLGPKGIISRIGFGRDSFIKWTQIAGVSVRTSVRTGDPAIVLQVKDPDSYLYDYRDITDRFERSKDLDNFGGFVIPLEPYGLEPGDVLPQILARVAQAQRDSKAL